MDDYSAKQFAAPTDFRVGEAICYFRELKRFQVVVRYKRSDKSRECEYKTIRDLQTSGVRLLNDLVSYNYEDANIEDERSVVRKFCEILIHSAAMSPLAPPQNL